MRDTVAASQRFTAHHPCPICGGHARLPAGEGKRCYGFLGSDKQYAHCTREELAGALPMEREGNTYAHRLHGPCHCGVQHGDALPEPPRATVVRNGAGRHIGATYDYTDEAGHLLYQAVRFEPKDFSQRQPDGRGGWRWTLRDVRRVLYRLPELLTAEPSSWVLVCEGEKDVDRLVTLGFVATTNAMGATNWDPSYSEQLSGRRVCLLLDNDTPGERRAGIIAESLQGVAAELRVLRLPGLPPGGDVSDWLDAGGTGEELAKLIVRAPDWNATVVPPERNRRLLAGTGGEKAPRDDTWPPPPPEVYHGWFGGYLELVSETTEAPDQFHLASALTIVGAYAGRSVFTKLASGRVYPNLYTVLVGLSSESKKDTAINRAWNMAIDPPWERERTVLPYVEKNSVASAESFIKGLSANRNVVIRMSEFSELLANARRKGTATILTMLMKAWDNPPQLSNDSIMNPATATNPYVSLLAGTQPDVLAADMIGTDISSGFANRVVFVAGSGKERKPRPPEVDEETLHAHWVHVRKNLQRYGFEQEIPVAWDRHIETLWDSFYLTPRGESMIERTLSQRHQVFVLKVALIFAITDGATRIGYEHLAHAIAFVDWHWEQVKRLAADWATGTDNRLANRIVAVLQKTGPIRRRDLQRKTNDPKWSPNDFARMVRSMIENQTLGECDGLIGLRDD